MISQILKNTLTNYLVVGVRFLQGILVTRWTIHYLGNEYYGLWALLWSFFAYSLLLNFGFGATVQKYTSTEIYKKDIKYYNKIISTIFTFQVGISLMLIAGSIAASFFLSTIFRIDDPAKLPYFRLCFFLFAIGAAVIFPTGLFTEILVGLRKFYVRNYIFTVSKILELVCTLLIFLLGGGLAALIVMPFVLWLASNLLMAFRIPRYIPGFRLSLQFDWKTCRGVANFSGFVYIISLAEMVLSKTSRLLISIFYGLDQVGIYHLSGRLADLSYMVVSQYQENVRPIAASLHAREELDELREFITRSMRWNCFMGLLIMLPAYIFAQEAFTVLFKVSSPEVIHLAHIFLFSMFLGLSTRQIPHSFLLMTDRHRFLTAIIVTEAVLNLPLNIIFLPRLGLSFVLWNSISIAAFLTFGTIFPILARTLKLHLFKWLWEVYLLPFLVCIPGAWLSLLLRNHWKNALGDFGTAALGGILCSGTFLVLSYFLLLKRGERSEIHRKLHDLILKYTH